MNRPRALRLAASVLALAIALPASAVQIRGDRSCGVWARDRDQSDKAWFMGYLSALAVYTDSDFLRGTDNESMYLWLDKYCRENPLKSISDGADQLAGELGKRRQQRGASL